MSTAAPNGPGAFWNARSLRFMLPIEPTDHVFVVGPSPTLTESLHAEGTSVVSVLRPSDGHRAQHLSGEVRIAHGDTFPCSGGAASHVLAPEVGEDYARFVPGELARVLQPGGGLFLGTPHRLRSRTRPAVHVRSGRRRLEGRGFADVRVYGVLHNLARPRHLVPLDSAAALRWYFESAYLPLSRRGALAVRLARMATVPGATAALFPALGFVARRRLEPC